MGAVISRATPNTPPTPTSAVSSTTSAPARRKFRGESLFQAQRLWLGARKRGTTVAITSPTRVASGPIETTVMTNKLIIVEDEDGSKMINKYVILRSIGNGSFGKVKLCMDNGNRAYAMKMMNKNTLRKNKRSDGNTSYDDAMREIAIMRRCRHDNVIKLYEVIDDPKSDELYLCMEYAENGALKTENPLTMEKCKRYFSQLITGLAYRKSLQLSNHLVHTRGICHRDIKPENLLLTSLDTIKISDFGVSYEFKDDDTLKSTAGTPAFQSPESCTERPYSGKAADIWAAGITLYILVYGYPPFGGDSYHEIYQSILNKQLEFPNIPDSLRDLFSRILDKNPETRIKLEQIQQHKWVV